MAPVERVAFIENYIEPVIHHRVCQIAFRVVTEIVKILAAKIFLELLCRRFLPGNANLSSKKIFLDVVVAPVVEEILFRGIFLGTIYLAQKADIGEGEERIQRVFRVHLSALFFAAAHLANPHPDMTSALLQFAWCYVGGVTFGYLTEKYHTLSVGILAHGFNNALVTAAMLSPSNKMVLRTVLMFWGAIMANQLAWYILATTSIEKFREQVISNFISSKVSSSGYSCSGSAHLLFKECK